MWWEFVIILNQIMKYDSDFLKIAIISSYALPCYRTITSPDHIFFSNRNTSYNKENFGFQFHWCCSLTTIEAINPWEAVSTFSMSPIPLSLAYFWVIDRNNLFLFLHNNLKDSFSLAQMQTALQCWAVKGLGSLKCVALFVSGCQWSIFIHKSTKEACSS